MGKRRKSYWQEINEVSKQQQQGAARSNAVVEFQVQVGTGSVLPYVYEDSNKYSSNIAFAY